MKNFVFIVAIFLFCCATAIADIDAPRSETVIGTFGDSYLKLRNKLIFDEAGCLNLDELMVRRENNIDILYRLLNDGAVTKSGVGLFNSLKADSSDLVFNECRLIINGIIDLLILGGGYQNVEEGMRDDWRRLDSKDRQRIIEILSIRNEYYSLFYQKVDNMPKQCSDIYAKYIFHENRSTKETNMEAISEFKGILSDGCIRIGVLSHYADALEQEGHGNNAIKAANTQILNLYHNYFNKLSKNDLNQNTALNFLQKIVSIQETMGASVEEMKVIGDVANLIVSGSLKIEDKPIGVRKGYFQLLSNSTRYKTKESVEVVKTLRNVYKEKGDIFKITITSEFQQLNTSERQFLESIKN